MPSGPLPQNQKPLDRPTQSPFGKEPQVPFAPTSHARRSRSGGLTVLLIGLALASCQARPLGAQEAEKEAVRAANRRFFRAEGCAIRIRSKRSSGKTPCYSPPMGAG